MGWYTNYEVELADHIDWDDIYATVSLKPFNAQHLYLRDLDKPRVILCLYSQNSIEDIIAALKTLYPVAMRYRIYNSDLWSEFC